MKEEVLIYNKKIRILLPYYDSLRPAELVASCSLIHSRRTNSETMALTKGVEVQKKSLEIGLDALLYYIRCLFINRKQIHNSSDLMILLFYSL
ncbi:hypothetical protein GJ744_005371 [Endocarpon pusillum]|uniref:Uncharacterized protein n=1 Tax=Endocarpon pusillum TaxID=364733 RepID=A0A8H7AL51_9EURO|nr:hypothetical protein GJ744_005371 [Endocarpon pusillum]